MFVSQNLGVDSLQRWGPFLFCQILFGCQNWPEEKNHNGPANSVNRTVYL